jgi:isopenicillin N synthase-like dioxygenase
VVDHGVETPVTARAFAEAQRFFALPAAEKQTLLMTRGEPRGYEPIAFQQLEAARPHDMKESFSIALDLDAADPRVNDGLTDGAPNRWPATLPGFRDGILDYYAAVTGLGAHLMSLVASSLALNDDFFVDAYRDTNPTLRMLRYPPDQTGTPNEQIGAGAHTDWGGITVLAQDDAGGLEVRDPLGSWIAAPPLPGAFLINLGDLMVRWTNGRYRSSWHRVINTVRSHDRYSIALFYSPNVRARIECVPTCVSASEPAQYAPCTAGEHVAERRRETYGLAT